MARSLTLKIEPVSGTFNHLVVWLNGTPVIQTDGTADDWKGTVPAKVKVETAAWGEGSAKYKLTIDLPGTAEDQKLEFKLTKGYHDAKLEI